MQKTLKHCENKPRAAARSHSQTVVSEGCKNIKKLEVVHSCLSITYTYITFIVTRWFKSNGVARAWAARGGGLNFAPPKPMKNTYCKYSDSLLKVSYIYINWFVHHYNITFTCSNIVCFKYTPKTQTLSVTVKQKAKMKHRQNRIKKYKIRTIFISEM